MNVRFKNVGGSSVIEIIEEMNNNCDFVTMRVFSKQYEVKQNSDWDERQETKLGCGRDATSYEGSICWRGC